MKRTALRRRRPADAREKAARDYIRRQVFERDGRCLLAGGGPAWCRFGQCFGALTPHHLQKASAGGAYAAENLVALCARHNDMQEDLPQASLAVGLTVARGVDHAEAERRRQRAGIVP